MRMHLMLLVASMRQAIRPRRELTLENLALRQELAVCARQSRRPHLRDHDHRFWAWLARTWSVWCSALGARRS